MSTRAGTPIDGLLDTLEQRMGVEHVSSAEATPSQRDRVLWQRSGPPVYGSIPYRVTGEHTLGRYAHPYTATIYAQTDHEVTALLTALTREIERLLGPEKGAAELETLQADNPAPLGRGFELKPGQLRGVPGLDGTATGMAQDVTVTVYTRVRRSVRGTAEGAPRLQVTPAEPASLDTPTEYAWSA